MSVLLIDEVNRVGWDRSRACPWCVGGGGGDTQRERERERENDYTSATSHHKVSLPQATPTKASWSCF